MRADEGKLGGGRLFLYDDGDAPKLIAKGRRKSLERVDDHLLDLVVGRIPGKHPETITGLAADLAVSYRMARAFPPDGPLTPSAS